MSCDGTTIGWPLAGERILLVGHHQHARLHLRFERQRHVHRHLVAVEVGVERRADQRMQLDRLAFDQHRLKRLNAQPVQRRGTVEQHRMLANHFFEDVPDLGLRCSTMLLGALDGVGVARSSSLRIMNGLNSSSAIFFGRPHWCSFSPARPRSRNGPSSRRACRAGSAGTALLALDHVRQRLERTLVGPGHWPCRVDRCRRARRPPPAACAFRCE